MRTALLFSCILSLSFAFGQRDWDKVEITSEKLSDGIYVLFGSGGNMGLAVGDDTAYLIDDQFAPLTDKILAAIAAITSKPVKFIVNTHLHGDHTGGNENLSARGGIIIAHQNVHSRMKDPQGRGGARSFGALPEITYTDRMTLHLDPERAMYIMHVNNAHTDGDSYIYFPKDNVLHMGDNMTNGYPFIDLNSGGDIDGLIKNLNMVLFMVNDETRIIPGHGPVVGRTDIEAYRNMLMTIRTRVKDAKDEGGSLEEVLQMGLSAEWDAEKGQGFIGPAQLIEAVYKTVD